MDQAVADYGHEASVEVQVQYGGSGQLLSNLEVARKGNLYVAADRSYIEIGRAKGLIAEVIPLATMHPVIVTAKDNPKGIASLDDLTRSDVRLGLADPERTAVGKAVQRLLTPSGTWEKLAAHAAVLKPTVNNLAGDVAIGSTNAAIVWDTTSPVSVLARH